jgi:hypothetical protein
MRDCHIIYLDSISSTIVFLLLLSYHLPLLAIPTACIRVRCRGHLTQSLGREGMARRRRSSPDELVDLIDRVDPWSINNPRGDGAHDVACSSAPSVGGAVRAHLRLDLLLELAG